MKRKSPKVAAPAACMLIANQHGARLLAATRQHGSTAIHLDEIAARSNTLIGHDRGGRPVAAGARRTTYADPDRDHDIMRDQFAADVVTWVANELRYIPTDGTLRLFAPPEFLGALRHALATRPLPAKLSEHAADLAELPTSELERHTAVLHEFNPAA